MTKTITLTALKDMLAEGPEGRAKIEKQKQAIGELTEALALMARRQRPYEVPISTDDNTLRFGLIGDTHIGSLYQRLDALQAFYAHCEREGIADVFHVGDVLAGWRVYKGQEFELHPNGRSFPEQLAMFAEGAPRINGITTHFITGNHDNSYKKLVGLIVGDEIQNARPDWRFIGQDIGTVTLKAKSGHEFKLELLHPGGGTAYAVSYHAQKTIETIPGGRKPDLLAIGHYHKAEFMPAYRNVAAVQVGCFEDQTPFMVQHSIAAHVGGWIVTVVLGDRKKLTSRVRAEFLAFYEAQE